MKQNLLHCISLALLAVFAGCADDTENFDNQLYLNSTAPTTYYVKTTNTGETAQFILSVPRPAAADITFSVKADASQLAAYEAVYGETGVQALPEGCYSFSSTESVIPAGALQSDPITLTFSGLNALDYTSTYVLPVSVTDASIGILGSARTAYYVFKGAALINVVANLKENNVYVDWVNPDVVQNLTTMTAEALIRPHSLNNQLNTLMGIEGQFLLRFGDAGLASNQLQIATGSGNYTDPRMTANLEEWLHVAVAYDSQAGTLQVYFNGRLVGDFTGVTYGPVNWGIPHSDEADGKPRCFWIGYSYNNERWLDADMAEVRIWNRVLTQDEILSENHFYSVDPATAQGLAAYWKFDDKADVIKDYSGNGNDATASAPLTWVSVELPAPADK